MQPVNFQCGHCGNVMGVNPEYLGQPVRCPHCQQIVVAPAESPASAPAAESPLPDLYLTDPVDPVSSLPVAEVAPGEAVNGEVVAEVYEPRAAAGPEPVDLPWTTPAPADTPYSDAPAPLQDTIAPLRKPREPSGKINLFLPLVFLPLLLYAVLATGVATVLYTKLKAMPASPFDSAPDVEGDTPGVRKDKPKLSYDRKFATQPLPAHLRTGLGQPLRVGDVEITPLRVERRKIEMVAEGHEDKPEPGPFDALVLHLRIKNCARDYAFTPLDNYFDRHWRTGSKESPPLTLLQAGDETFFGGPAKWVPLTGARRAKREWLLGRSNVDREGLAPGAQSESIVATDAWDAQVAQHLFGSTPDADEVKRPYRGKLLWRVQLRRGVVEWKGRRHAATAVIGVEFTDKDYLRNTG